MFGMNNKVYAICMYEGSTLIGILEAYKYEEKAEARLLKLKQAGRGKNKRIEGLTLPFRGNHLYYCRGYFGKDYDGNKVFKRVQCDIDNIHPSKELVKDYSRLWQEYMDRYMWGEPSIISVDDTICSLNKDGSMFTNGYYFEDKFRVSIEKVRINKRPVTNYEHAYLALSL